MGFNRTFEAFIGSIVAFIRPDSTLAWIPLAIIWFGLGDGAKIFVIWFTAFVPTLINTYSGAVGIDSDADRRSAGPRRDDAAPGVGRLSPRRCADDFRRPAGVAAGIVRMAPVAAELTGAYYGLGRT